MTEEGPGASRTLWESDAVVLFGRWGGVRIGVWFFFFFRRERHLLGTAPQDRGASDGMDKADGRLAKLSIPLSPPFAPRPFACTRPVTMQ